MYSLSKFCYPAWRKPEGESRLTPQVCACLLFNPHVVLFLRQRQREGIYGTTMTMKKCEKCDGMGDI